VDLGLIPRYGKAHHKAREYEKSALSSGLAISKHIADLSSVDGHIKVSNGSVIKLPFISHHANIAPIVAVLVQTIEHMIRHNTSTTTTDFSTSEGEGHGDSLLTGDAGWISSMKPLLSCLLDLDTTVAGSQTARKALRSLMTAHGDILMDCWAVDEAESQWSGMGIEVACG